MIASETNEGGEILTWLMQKGADIHYSIIILALILNCQPSSVPHLGTDLSISKKSKVCNNVYLQKSLMQATAGLVNGSHGYPANKVPIFKKAFHSLKSCCCTYNVKIWMWHYVGILTEG